MEEEGQAGADPGRLQGPAVRSTRGQRGVGFGCGGGGKRTFQGTGKIVLVRGCPGCQAVPNGNQTATISPKNTKGQGFSLA